MARRCVYAGSKSGTGQILKSIPLALATAHTIYRGDILAWSTAGASLITYTGTTAVRTSNDVWGVAAEDKTTTTATQSYILVDVSPDSLYEMAVTSSSLTAANVGNCYDVASANGSYTLDVADPNPAGPVVRLEKVISTSRVVCSLLNMVENK